MRKRPPSCNSCPASPYLCSGARNRFTWACLAQFCSRRRRRSKMERVSEILQFPVIIQRSRALSVEPQSLQEGNLFLHSIATQNAFPKEPFETRLFFKRPLLCF